MSSSSGGLTASPLNSNLGFNWVFLVELIVCGVLSLFFLFYFNRLFATLVSYGLRAWTWHKYRVYIDIQALQISLLGGRIFFKGFRYHGNNETILVHSGFITWCYWHWNVRELNVKPRENAKAKRASGSGSDEEEGRTQHGRTFDRAEEGGTSVSTKLPCRLTLSLNGVEWFVYNRSAAYDAVIAGMTQPVNERLGTVLSEISENEDSHIRLRKSGKQTESGEREAFSSHSTTIEKDVPQSTEKHGFSTQRDDAPPINSQPGSIELDAQGHTNTEEPFILRFLPIHVSCVKAAVVVGNENTKSVLIVKAEKAEGEIDASEAKTLDQYRQLFNFNFEHPVVQMKPNDDYKEDQTDVASRVKLGDTNQPGPKTNHIHTHSFIHRQRRRVWHTLQDLVPAFRSSVDSLSSSDEPYGSSPQAEHNSSAWRGLSRYIDESEQDDKARWNSIEYATVSTIVDSPEASMSFYWDVVGNVPEPGDPSDRNHEKDPMNINGDIPPEWGLDLSLKGGLINYGPWADRQRADIQRVFFPSLCKDASPSKHLAPGQFRIPTEFKVYIEFNDETTLRVPIREGSKNWKWTKQADSAGAKQGEKKSRGNRYRRRKADKGATGPEIRPFGWLDLTVGANATVAYSMDMVAGPSGFANKLELDLPDTEITTSVNHGLLWRSVENRISCDLSNPLQWNGLRTWKFDVTSNGLELFILREHVFLLIDLIDDWGSGPPPEYLTFAPFIYLVNLHLGDFRLYLNVNDSNIINNPSDFDDNTFIIIFGSALSSTIRIPLDTYRPHRNDISFDVDARNGGLNLHVPPWNTQATFLSSTELATLKDLSIQGKYQYCATTLASNTDTLVLTVHGHAPSAHFYGFVIRYFLKIKDNYFGDDIRFKTLEEYQEVLRARRDGRDEKLDRQPHKKSNDLDVVLAITADDSNVILPANLYSAKEHTRIEIAALAADLRFTNYYMDLDVALSTLAFSSGSEQSGACTPLSATSSAQLFVDGVTAYGNRLFGLPPTEPTYVCNWDFDVGTVTGECTMDFFGRLMRGVKAFAFSFDDDENALPSISEVALHDITFLRASVESVRVWLHVEDAAFLLSTANISIVFNDWAGSHYSRKLNLTIPELCLSCVNAESASRHRSRVQNSVETHAFVQTTLSVAMIQRKLGFEKDRQLQQEHVKRHDQRTHRAGFLLHPYLLDDSMLTNTDPPAMCVPSMPTPVIGEAETQSAAQSIRSDKSPLRHQRHFTDRKTSFLSVSSSSQKSDSSVLRSRSSRRLGDLTAADSSAGLGRRTPLRDVSTSTGRRSSFYSAVGDSRGLPPSSVTFSSSYMAPYFPLEAVVPDSKDLPATPQDPENDLEWSEPHFSLDDIHPDGTDVNASHSSFIVELPSGLAGVFNAKAVDAVTRLLGALHVDDPVDILDELQIGCGNEMVEPEKQKDMAGNIVDLNVRTPWINFRFLNAFSANVLGDIRDMHDQYDISVHRLTVTSRSQSVATKEGVSQDASKVLTVHLAVESANVSANERYSDITDPQAAINGLLEDVTCWVVSGENTSAEIAFKGIEVATASSKIEYLASLLHRTGVVAADIAESFSSLASHQRNRLQLFTYLVATAGQEAPDPLFLTRPSYVLRSAPDHLRTSDSWKIVTRLHHMYDSLDLPTKERIALCCLKNSEPVPVHARDDVLAAFDNWRSWDLNDVEACSMMQTIYGHKDKDDLQAPTSSQPTKLTFRTELVRLVLDPGPKENEISLVGITSAFEDKILAGDSEPQSPLDSYTTHITTVQLFCADASINLNWELCELVDDIMKLVQNGKPSKPGINPSPVTSSRSAVRGPKHELHVIIATDKGSITIDTVNIRLVSISQGLTGSFIMIDNAIGQNKSIANLMLAAEAATTKIKSHSQDLSLHQIRFPCIYTSYERQLNDGKSINAVKFAGNCQELSFVIQQDILAVIEVLDLVIGDEIAQLHRLRQRMPAAESSQAQPLVYSGPNTSSLTQINVALFLDMYQISIPLLQSLTYGISGTVARASVAAQLGSEVAFDFDVKEHSHHIQTSVANTSKSISLLQMPATNGCITSNTSERGTTISVFASVEPVKLDAAAIHSLLTALNRPEISSVIADAQTDIKGIQAHIEEIFGQGQNTVNRDKEQNQPLLYDAHLTVAGFDIFANAHGAQGTPNRARLDFKLGCVQLVFANRLEQNGPVLEFPELRVSLQNIMFELSRWNKDAMQPCGNLSLAAFLTATSKINDSSDAVRSLHLKSDAIKINLFAETASSVVEVMGYLQTKIKDIDLSRERNYLRKLRRSKPRITINEENDMGDDKAGSVMFSSMYSLELLNIQVCWVVGTYNIDPFSQREREDLVLSLKRIDLSTSKEHTARLTIEDLQLQMVPASHDKMQRSLNSALLPEIVFNTGYVSTTEARRMAFQAAGKSLDLRLTSQFMIPGEALRKSIKSAADKVRAAQAIWSAPIPGPPTKTPRQTFLGTKRMESLLVDAYFAGAVVYLSGKKISDTSSTIPGVKGGRAPQTGRYGQFTQSDTGSNTILRAPGLAWKVEYKDDGLNEPSLNAEIRVDASSNILYPAVVPLIMEVSSTVKDIVNDEDANAEEPQPKLSPQNFMGTDEDNILTADPSTVLGRTRLNLGFRICRQEFSLSCQPIARVAATARFDDIYITVNTVRSSEHGHFFAASATFSNLQASVQHVYSRESTGSFEVESVFLSLMNSRHVSNTSGLSAILKISPMKVLVNAKQLQDFLLFREIWVPPEIRQRSPTTVPTNSAPQSQTYLVQRYQQVAATGAFPWNATVSIAELDVQLDLGQAIGKSAFMISNFWISSRKNSDWEQNLCLGFDKVGVDSTGRMSGLVSLQDFKVRTSIQWPAREKALNQTPLIQGSLAFSQFRFKAAFDYQAFLVADITSFEFFMYNVRTRSQGKGDHLVAVLDGEAIQVFCTTTTASQSLALYQAFLRLVKEKRANYETSLAEIEKFMQRKTILSPQPTTPQPKLDQQPEEDKLAKTPISLHTNVIVTLKAVNIGAFPNTFSDHQVFKLEALNAQARFAVTMNRDKIHSNLGLTLGQLRIGLAGVKAIDMPKSVGEISVEDVVKSATGSRGGTILKVPRVEASMQTWQAPGSNHIDYIFKSSFEGKVEVGWNYSRISYIRSMWASHSKALAQRLGKPLPITAVKITGVPDEESGERKEGEPQKITAEVNVPQSKYDYTALEPPIIETPQLRDMGEATPPLEWIGLHRDRLPNLTHQIVIVTLLELAREVDDAYEKILGSS